MKSSERPGASCAASVVVIRRRYIPRCPPGIPSGYGTAPSARCALTGPGAAGTFAITMRPRSLLPAIALLLPLLAGTVPLRADDFEELRRLDKELSVATWAG